jgi:hypothetical protein
MSHLYSAVTTLGKLLQQEYHFCINFEQTVLKSQRCVATNWPKRTYDLKPNLSSIYSLKHLVQNASCFTCSEWTGLLTQGVPFTEQTNNSRPYVRSRTLLTYLSFIAVREAFSDACRDRDLPNNTTVYQLVTKFWNTRYVLCLREGSVSFLYSCAVTSS